MGWSLLSGNPAFRRLWIARTVSYFGSALTRFALALYVQQVFGTGVSVGFILLALALPQALGPLAGVLADRVEQRRLMVLCDLGQALLVGLVALLLPPFPVLFALMAGASLLSTLFLPAGRSAVPALVPARGLNAANAFLGASFNAGLVAGPALAGVIFAGFGARAAFALDAITFLLSAALLPGLPELRSAVADATGVKGFLRETREGLSHLARHRIARAVAAGLFLSVAFAALDDVALVFLVRETLGAGATEYGVTAAMYGVGMVLAPLLLLRGRGRLSDAGVLLTGLALTGVGDLLTGLAPAVALAMAFQLVAGSGNGLENVATDTLIGKTVPRTMLGRVFGATYGSIFFAQALALASGGFLLSLTSARTVFVIAGSGVLLTLLLVWRLLPRRDGGV